MKTVDEIISAKWIIPVTPDQKTLKNSSLIIDKGTIIDILPTEQVFKHYTSKEHSQLDQHALLPGFINAHTHAAMSMFRGYADDLALMTWLNEHIWPAEAKWLSEQFVYDGSLLSIAEMIKSGTTCFNDMYIFPNAVAKAAIDAKIRAHVGLVVFDFPTQWGDGPTEYFAKSEALISQHQDDNLISFTIAPHAPYTVSDDTFTKAYELAQQHHLRIHCHIHETKDEVNNALTESGQRPLERLNKLGVLGAHCLAVHMTQLTDADIETVKSTGTHVIHCPESNMKLASGFCPTKVLADKEVNIALGTDGQASNNDLDMISEMRTAALIAKGYTGDAEAIPATKALEMATINGAKALGIDHITGSLEAGKRADVIAIELDLLETSPVYNPISNIVYASNRSQVTHNWVDGKQLLKDKKLTTIDEKQLAKTTEQWRKKIVNNG